MEAVSALRDTCTFYGVVSPRGVNYESISVHVLIGSGLRAPFTSGAVGRRLPSQRVTIAAPGSSAYL